MLKVIAFDLFGTVFDLSGINRDEVRAYVAATRLSIWTPLRLPESWSELPAWPDSAEGIAKLRERFTVVTCSNAPLGTQAKLCKRAGITFDALIPLELSKAYKPKPAAYMTVCDVLGVEPREVAMVTANKDFGDLEASARLGMTPHLIRHPGRMSGEPETIIELAEILEP